MIKVSVNGSRSQRQGQQSPCPLLKINHWANRTETFQSLFTNGSWLYSRTVLQWSVYRTQVYIAKFKMKTGSFDTYTAAATNKRTKQGSKACSWSNFTLLLNGIIQCNSKDGCASLVNGFTERYRFILIKFSFFLFSF